MQPLPGNRLIAADVAVARADEGIKAYELQDIDSFKGPLQNVQAGQPVLVQRLDRLDSFYYIVPFTGTAGTTSAAFAVDARTCIYRQSVVRRSGRDSVIALPDRNAAVRSVVGRTVELPSHLGRMLIRPEAVCHYPTLVWKPCVESLSPFFPFHMFTVGAHSIYVRTDGVIFTELHDAYRGI